MAKEYPPQILDFHETDAWFPDTTIHHLFEEQVKKTPHKIAVYSYQNDPMTYRQLNEKANQLAAILRRKGVGPDKIVAMLIDRSPSMIIGIMGILKAGGAYLPISPADPPERIRYMVEESQVEFLLVQNKTVHAIPFDGETINLDNDGLYSGPSENLIIINKPDDLAYVIFTSGSTGRPKGVMIEHRSVVNRLHWMQKRYPIDDTDTLLQKTPYNFDVSVWELFWWAFNGASVCFLIPGGEKIPFIIIEAIKQWKITVLHFVPSMMNVFLEYIKEKEPIEIKKLSFLKKVFVSGEALHPGHLKKFNENLGQHTMASLTNLYGPTEATVDVTFYDCPRENIEKIPIGKPIDNIQLFVLSDDDEIQAVGETGELCISGVGLARGYLNNVLLTKEKFIDNPFLPGKKMYKTGDIARWLPDGNIEYLGRKDFQVKIRGLRIELGEIENVIMQYPTVRDCLVTVHQISESIILIVAYYVAEEELPANTLKEFLKIYLPDYMIPNRYIKIEKIPLTSNGKANRKELPAPSI